MTSKLEEKAGRAAGVGGGIGGGVDVPVTVVALERLRAGVFAVVPRQFVAPGESPLAAFPRALVRLLTCR